MTGMTRRVVVTIAGVLLLSAHVRVQSGDDALRVLTPLVYSPDARTGGRVWRFQAGLQAGVGAPARAAVERGKATFQESCAPCHGGGGKGNGPAADAMKQRPTNLTTLARQKGAFRASEVEASIKGASPVVAHGAPGMMVGGTLFLAEANGNQSKADARIRDVVAFIESIQVK
jgi:mono/diheme cytochrome c family protein